MDIDPDESIPGALARATAGHHLEKLNTVLKEAGLPAKHAGATQLMPPEALAELADVMRCGPLDLVETVGRRLVEAGPRRGRHYVAFGDLVLPRSFLDLRRRCVAPTTLASAPRHRTAWLVTVLPYCPASLERLVDACPGCGAALGWIRTRGIGRCETCEAVLPPSAQPMLLPEAADDYRLFAGLVSPTRIGRAEAYAALPERLRGLPPGDLVRLAVKWGLEAADEDGSVVRAWQTRATKLPPERLAAVVTGGAGLLRSWPEGLRDWALPACGTDGSTAAPDLRRRVRRMAVGDAGYSARFDVVREALPADMLKSAGTFADGRRTYSGREVRRRLPQSGEHLRALRASGAIPFTTTRRGGEYTYRYCADRVDAATERAGDAVSFGSVQRSLGLPVYALEQFFCSALLERLDDPVLRILLRRPMTSASAVKRLEADLISTASKRKRPANVLPIGQESRRIGGRPKPWHAIYSAMLSGDVPFWLDGRPHVDCLLVRQGVLDRFLDVHFDAEAHADASFAGAMDTNDAAEMLNVIPATIRQLRAEQILSDEIRPRSRVSQRDEVEALARDYVSAAELARLARTSAGHVNRVLRKADAQELVPGFWIRTPSIAAVFRR